MTHRDGMQAVSLPTHLTRTEYLMQLAISDLVLLPYDALAYKERTSGIFIETIVAGKMPAVTRGTWMAGELARYDLSELIVDWNAPAVLTRAGGTCAQFRYRIETKGHAASVCAIPLLKTIWRTSSTRFGSGRAHVVLEV